MNLRTQRTHGATASSVSKLSILVCAAALAGCGTTAERAIFSDGTDGIAKRTLNANVRAMVSNDERQGGFVMNNFDRAAGVGPAERAYRRVSLMLILEDGGKPLFGRYSGMRAASALIPDGMPLLEKGDIVEVRTRAQWDGLKDFAQTGEGPAVLRIECQSSKKASKENVRRWKACADKLSWVEAWGESNRYYFGILAKLPDTPYRASLKDHTDLYFTPFYGPDDEPLATRVIPAPRTGP
jgi:hypothetical protein